MHSSSTSASQAPAPTAAASPPPIGRLPASPISRWLALGAVAGPSLFTATWFILGFLSPGYSIEGEWIPFSPIAQPISGLGMGVTGPYMNGGFVLGGILLFAGLIGIFRVLPNDGRTTVHRTTAHRTAAAALALAPLGLVLAGLFTIEEDAPHFLGFILAAGTPIVTFPITGIYLRRLPAWRRFGTGLIGAGLLTLLLVIIYMVSFDVEAVAANEGVAGLTSRVLAGQVHAWFIALGWLAFRRSGIERRRREV